jgi:hypothetical protein
VALPSCRGCGCTGRNASGPLAVALDWAELTWTAAGQRKFKVAITGTQVLTSIDVIATAGYKTALQKQFSVAANSSGQIVSNRLGRLAEWV